MAERPFLSSEKLMETHPDQHYQALGEKILEKLPLC